MLAPKLFQKTNRSAYVNFLRAKYEGFIGQVEVKSRPYYLSLDPCDICQLRCPTCPTGMENESRKVHAPDKIQYRNKRAIMSLDLYDSMLDELGEFLFLINFYNYGEPLLNKQLPAFIRKATAAGIETEVHTNLSLPLTDAQIDDLLTSGLTYLNCSIDGFTQENYQKHRVGGDINLVKKNLERLAKAKVRLGSDTFITYKYLVFSFNEHEVNDAAQYCKDLGINFIHGEAFVYDQEWLPSYRKSEKPYYSEEDVKRLVADWEAAGLGDYWGEHEKRAAWLSIVPYDESKSPSYCAWHYGYSVITAGGPVAPCCAVAKERDDFGTIVPDQVSFGDIWNNKLYQSSRATFASKSTEGLPDTVCTRCYFPKFVQHLYSGHDLKVFGQFAHVFGDKDPVLQQAFRLWFMSEKAGPAVRTMFVEYFEANLLNDLPQAPPAKPEKPRVWTLSEQT